MLELAESDAHWREEQPLLLCGVATGPRVYWARGRICARLSFLRIV